MISNVSKVVMPVEDQQAALEFWTTTIGFTAGRDETYGDERWIEVRPPHQDLLLVLSPRRADEPRRAVPDSLPHSDLFFNCADIEQTYAELSRRGVRFPLPPARQQFRWWALFEDNEGTRYALGQWDDPARSARPGTSTVETGTQTEPATSVATNVSERDDGRPAVQPPRLTPPYDVSTFSWAPGGSKGRPHPTSPGRP